MTAAAKKADLERNARIVQYNAKDKAEEEREAALRAKAVGKGRDTDLPEFLKKGRNEVLEGGMGERIRRGGALGMVKDRD